MQTSYQNAVYILDPDEAIRDGVRVLLDSFDIKVLTYANGRAFLQDADSAIHGCALIESQLPDLDGLTLLSRLREMGNNMPVLLLTSSPDEGLARHALESGVASVIRKPMDSEHLLRKLASILQPPPPGLAAFRT